MSNELAILDGATRALAEVSTAGEAWQLARDAEAARTFAKMRKLGTRATNYATGIKAKAMLMLADYVDRGQADGTIGKPAHLGKPLDGGQRTSVPEALDEAEHPQRAYDAVREARQLRDALAGSDVDELVERANEEGRDFALAGLRVAAGAKPHPAHNTGISEWYTPADIINSARGVLGAIDLDPASSEIANRTVGAARIFTADDDGLAQPWRGRVWMNPPYTARVIDLFIAKLVDEHRAGNVAEAIVLTNNSTDTSWWQSLASFTSAVCFPGRRVRFLDPDGKPGSPLQGQAIGYLGTGADRFADHFGRFGQVL